MVVEARAPAGCPRDPRRPRRFVATSEGPMSTIRPSSIRRSTSSSPAGCAPGEGRGSGEQERHGSGSHAEREGGRLDLQPPPLELPPALRRHRARRTSGRVRSKEGSAARSMTQQPSTGPAAGAPPSPRASSTLTAATSPAIGSAMASPQNTGSPSASLPTRPPATAASSPKATARGAASLPWPVMLSQTAPGASESELGSRPIWASARGRVDSMITSAPSSSPRSRSLPSAERSRARPPRRRRGARSRRPGQLAQHPDAPRSRPW